MRGKRIRPTVIIAVTILAMALIWGCQKKTEEINLDEEPAVQNVPMPKVPSTIKIPDEIAGKWKAVVVEVTDKDSNEKTDVTVNIGDTVPLGATGFKIYVEAFLPSFTMSGDVYTSTSADLNNPAAKVTITDAKGNEVFNSWLFALYPATHPFQHDKYAVILKDYVAAK
ncbi:MAG: DUF2155 domain-containing protein [Deltaproteobacteria bacterium]|nr:DUF2155 domain-containing protein [Deltaproteobacteria bacterium]